MPWSPGDFSSGAAHLNGSPSIPVASSVYGALDRTKLKHDVPEFSLDDMVTSSSGLRNPDYRMFGRMSEPDGWVGKGFVGVASVGGIGCGEDGFSLSWHLARIALSRSAIGPFNHFHDAAAGGSAARRASGRGDQLVALGH
ncbi:hypothetical protein FZI85_08630 [Mycobacterium sp. CBMA293]|uniref:hypothetical protein n=2 Tax=unclassified Mycolicibacterium TaxID=2636767 RepID=UPI0012DE98C7|nr:MULTISPECIES: hypothetical protein [unclassified Mycolicibacterium]MUL57149.1 hypothetical protein [Mycolicibacterium sp. CBMA 335]MUL70189.1 hypothetical protein [Mycolicibacterium sp. CBMA 311]MUM11093.1 hypothetical protein [Mycolicibacterium sp. CBMA 293]